MKTISRKCKRLRPRAKSLHYWEYYNRIQFMSNQIRGLGLPECRILDAGGATGDNLLRQFGIQQVVTLDVLPTADVTGQIPNLPFRDRSFDVATCIDTLEHIPPDHRKKSVEELIRVAREAVFLVAPFNSEENNRAEEIVLKYVKDPFLFEHRRYGLVRFDEIDACLDRSTKKGRVQSVEKVYLDDLLTWVMTMAKDHVDESILYQEAFFLENRFCPRRIAVSISLNHSGGEN